VSDMIANSPWTSPTSQPALPGGDVHLWRILLDQPEALVRQMSDLLSTEEASRANRFIPDVNRQRFIVGRGSLRTILGCYLGLEPKTLDFHYGAHGKPELPESACDGPRLCFNLSHSHNVAVLAVTMGREIGVDVEQIRAIAEMDSIVTRLFSAAERDEFYRLAVSERQSAFFRIWTRKEAYVKALGDGLAVPLDEFDVSVSPDEPARLCRVAGRPQEALRWTLADFLPCPGYLGSVAVEGCDWRVRCFHSEPAGER
jgi:4'-phosphopantetheinyl transferase